jgi:hypothetical protein
MRRPALFLFAAAATFAQPDPFLRWMDGIAQRQLDERASRLAAITTPEQVRQRQAEIKAKLLEIIGGLPDYNGPLHARITGVINADGYAIEKVLFQSLPGYYVTANVYRPLAKGRYPAVLLQSGHTQEGKPEPQIAAANLALQGYVAMTFDPVGQGEREQTYLPMLGRALSGGSVNEHLAMGAQAIWMNQSVVRYFVHDARRAIDYLVSRGDVDASAIGAAGCSGAGALTSYTAALDDRVKAAAPACFLMTYRALFSGPTTDSEMSPPLFIASGLDQADMYILSATKPWLLMATEEDYFPPVSARPVYEEARRIFAILGAPEKIRFHVGPGPHGTPVESRTEIYRWMAKWLRNGAGDATERPVRQYTNLELRVTKSGNVADEPGSRRLHEILREELTRKRKPASRDELRAELQRLGVVAPGVPAVKTNGDEIVFDVEPGVPVRGRLYVPSAPGRKPAVLLIEDKPMPQPLFVSRTRPTAPLAEALYKQGHIVLEMEPRDSPLQVESRAFVGNWLANTRANLIGLNLPAMRARDILRGVDLLAAREDVSEIRGAARGVKGIWLLMAAAVDARLKKVWVDRTPHSVMAAYDRPIGQFLTDALIPGFALRYEFGDFVEPERLLWSDPTDWMNRVVPLGGAYRYRYTGESDDALIDAFTGRTRR